MPGIPTFVPAPLIDERDYGQYARRRPTSASSLPQRPSSAKPSNSRPSSAKTYTPKRPQSAHGRSDKSQMDYSGISNMIKTLNLKKSRFLREKSPENKRSINSPKAPQKPQLAWKEKRASEKDNVSTQSTSSLPNKTNLDIQSIRRHRSSHYAKFKYPQNYHYGPALSYKAFLERNIPQCLRRYPRYGNQPKRQSCNFNPPNGVTQIKWHSLKSGPLPAYKGPGVPKSAPASIADDSEDRNGEEDIQEDNNSEPHNGSYHYVYEGKSEDKNEIFYDVEDFENELNNNITPRADDNYSLDEFEEEEDQGPESVEIPVRETPVVEDIVEDLEWENAPVTPRTGNFTSAVPRETNSDAESIKSWIDPDEDKSYYEEKNKEEDADIPGEDIPDQIDRLSDIAESVKSESDHSVKSEGSKLSKSSKVSNSSKASKQSNSSKASKNSHSSKASKQSSSSKSSKSSKNSSRLSNNSGSMKFSESDIRDILDDNAEDPIEEYMNGSTNSLQNGRYSRMDEQDSAPEQKVKKTVRIQEPVIRPTTPGAEDDEDDIPEDYGSDEDQFDMKDLGSLPPLRMMGSSMRDAGPGLTPAPPAGKSRFIRPSSARRQLQDEDF